MARLTILQASQQGFGSTLMIHRHIKDGSLPTYEEGDTKLLDVDDLIALFGEPGGGTARAEASDTGPDRIDMYEYNRMKSELDQKNKKNMWLAADLAEVVREMKEKEAKFEAERDRLLKVLEQAQVLLLREAERAGGPLKNTDGSILTLDQVVSDNPANPVSEPAAEAKPDGPQFDNSGGNASPDKSLFMPEPVFADLPPQNEGESLSPAPPPANSTEAVISTENIPTDIHAGTAEAPPGAVAEEPNDAVAAPDQEAASTIPEELEPLNPLIPPLEAQRAEPEENRFLGTTTWLLLLTLVGGGFVFFEFRTQVMTSVTKIMKVLGGV